MPILLKAGLRTEDNCLFDVGYQVCLKCSVCASREEGKVDTAGDGVQALCASRKDRRVKKKSNIGTGG